MSHNRETISIQGLPQNAISVCGGGAAPVHPPVVGSFSSKEQDRRGF
jgi:hypothetical protein